MSVIYGPELPPPPAGMTTAAASIIREQLHEDVFQTLSAYIGSGSTTGGLGGEGTKYYDIRTLGALPGQANKLATTIAFQSIFDSINADYTGGVTVTPGVSAVIFIPYSEEGWWVNETITYLGNPARQLTIIGLGPGGQSQTAGSSLIYDGPTGSGSKLFDIIAGNRVLIKGVCFNGQRKAKKVVHVRQYYDAGHSFLVGASQVDFEDCVFFEAASYLDSALVAYGQDDANPSTLQADTGRFLRCYFFGLDGGPTTLQGYGFHTEVGGNVKRFSFETCQFNYCWTGIYSLSGDLNVFNCAFASIGGYYRAGGSCINFGGNTLNVVGGGVENVQNTWCARYIIAGQGAHVNVQGIYHASVLPADDYAITGGAGVTLIGNQWLSNNRDSSVMTPASARRSAAVLVGEDITNDSGKAYRCITSGTTASSVGPTGVLSDIVDGTAHWKYMGSAQSITTKFQHTSSDVLHGSFGGFTAINNLVSYNTTPITAFPLFNGSNEHRGGNQQNENGWGGDNGRNTPARVFLFGNSTGDFLGSANYFDPLFNVYGCPVPDYSQQIRVDNTPAGVTILKNQAGIATFRVPYTVMQAGNGTAAQRTIRLCDLAPGIGVIRTYANVKTAFTGASGGFTMALGWHEDPSVDNLQAFLKDTDCKSGAVIIGAAAADIGTLQATDYAINGTYCPDRTGTAQVFLVLKSASSTMANLSAGSVDVTIVWNYVF